MAANGASRSSSAAILSGPSGLEAQTDAPPGGEGDVFVFGPREEEEVCGAFSSLIYPFLLEDP